MWHLTLKCKKKRVWRPGSAWTRWGAYSAFRIPTSKGGEGKGGEEEREGGKGRG